MTHLVSASDSALSWRGEVVWDIEYPAATHTPAAPLDQEGDSGYEGPEQDWGSHSTGAHRRREQIERVALSARVPGELVGRSRDPEGRTAPPSEVRSTATNVVPKHLCAFFTDMLKVDWFHLERMALLAAAHRIRLGKGLFGVGKDPATTAAIERKMRVLSVRITALAAAADLSPAEGMHIWGSRDLDSWRRLAAVTVNCMDDLALEHAWRSCAAAGTDPAIPPYIPVDPASDLPIGTARALPPTPSELLIRAAAALTVADTVPAPTMQADMPTDPADQPVTTGGAVERWGHGPVCPQSLNLDDVH